MFVFSGAKSLYMDKAAVKQKEEQLLNLVADFCAQRLNEEYLALAEKLIRKLGRKRDVPFMRGKPEIWAAGIIHALGSVNWMFDRDNPCYTPAADINAFFGTNGSSTSQKATLIKDLVGMERMDNEWATKHTKDHDPFAQFVMVDDMIVPMTMLPEEVQAEVKRLRAEGRDVVLQTK